jgi:hypothetical protein
LAPTRRGADAISPAPRPRSAWPPTLPWWLRAILVLPFAVVPDLGSVVTAAFADWRQRKAERAYGWRVLSASWIAIGVGINVVGDAATVYLSVC